MLVFGLGWGASWGCNMMSIGCASTSGIDSGTGRKIGRLFALALVIQGDWIGVAGIPPAIFGTTRALAQIARGQLFG